tara:strand:- start:1080 stop:1283 length:204 start_codon:yes stop_codon:yes gene_type:complete
MNKEEEEVEENDATKTSDLLLLYLSKHIRNKDKKYTVSVKPPNNSTRTNKETLKLGKIFNKATLTEI